MPGVNTADTFLPGALGAQSGLAGRWFGPRPFAGQTTPAATLAILDASPLTIGALYAVCLAPGLPAFAHHTVGSTLGRAGCLGVPFGSEPEGIISVETS